jgi:hypothetical protein
LEIVAPGLIPLLVFIIWLASVRGGINT